MIRTDRRCRPRSLTLALGLGTIAISLASSVPAPVRAQSAQPVALTGARVLDPEAGAPIDDATVVIRDGRIESVEAGGIVPAGVRAIDLAGRTLLPGLIDAHVHIGDLSAARRALLSGVTTARSMGSDAFADVGLRELHRRGAMPGPEILAAGYHVRPRPAEGLFVGDPELSDLLGQDIRGEERIRRVVASMRARGIDFVKVNATERAGLPETDPRKPFYTESELTALVTAAGGLPVAAHAHGDRGGRAAVLAGVRSIEHGTYLSRATLELMAERGTFLVPTIAVVVDLTLPGGDYDDPVLQVRGRHMLPRVREAAGTAHELGVPVVAATDTGYGPGSVLRLGHELGELVRAGLSERDALRAATSVAADLLGIRDRVGRIQPGYEADLIVVERDPLADIAAVEDVLFVMSDGHVALDRLEFRAGPVPD